MADLQDMRSRMRDSGYEAAAPRGTGLNIGFWLAAVAAAAVGFAIVLLAPRFYSVQRTAALPVSQAIAGKVETSAGGNSATGPQAPMPGDPARYKGMGADEMAALADAVCTQHAAPSRVLSMSDPVSEARKAGGQGDRVLDEFARGGNLTDRNERLQCLLTEAPARYCSGSQRSKIAANVINYLKAIEYKNVAVNLAARVAAVAPDVLRGSNNSAHAAMPGTLVVDPRVIEGVEGLLRSGYLLKAQREDIGSNAPREIKERLTRVVGNPSPCPQPPWWAVWK